MERGQELEPEDLGPGHQPSTWPNMTSLALGPFIPGKELHRAVLLKIGPEGSDLAWFGGTHSVNNNERPIPVLLMNFVSEKPIWGTYFMKSQV